METKICRECRITKILDEFEKDGKYKYKDGTVKININQIARNVVKVVERNTMTKIKIYYRRNERLNMKKIKRRLVKNVKKLLSVNVDVYLRNTIYQNIRKL